MESSIVIDVWTVEAERQDELIRTIRASLQRLAVGRPGFVSAEIYQGTDRNLVVTNLQMASAQERQALTDSPELHEVYRELRRIATDHVHLYHLVERLVAPPEASS